MASGIEVKAHCPTVLAQYRLNKVNVEIAGKHRTIGWDQPVYWDLPTGTHKVTASLQGLLTKSAERHLDVTVQSGEVAEVLYSLSVISLLNPGRLEVTGTRASAPGGKPAADPAKCWKCGKPVPPEADFCPGCGLAVPTGANKKCVSCGKSQPAAAGAFCMKCGAKMP